MRLLPDEISKKAAVAILALGVAVLGFRLLPSYWTDFFQVDDAALVDVPAFESRSATEALRVLFTPGTHVDFYPARDLSVAADRAICGPMKPGCHRVQGWLLFVAITALLHSVLRLLSGRRMTASLLTACYVFHPLQAEMLIWISSRKDILGVLFALLFWRLLLAFPDTLRTRMGRVGTAVLLLLSKANYLFLPVAGETAGALIETPFRRRRGFTICALLAVSVGLGWLHWRQYHEFTPVDYHRPLAEKIPLAAINVGKYAEAILGAPDSRFSLDFGRSWTDAHEFEKNVGSLLLGALLVVLFVLWRRRSPSFAPLAGLFALWLPASALLSDHAVVFASRYAMPLLPFALMTIAGGRWNPLQRERLHLLLLLWMVFLVPKQATEIERWTDPIDLWTSQLKTDPRHLETRGHLYLEWKFRAQEHPSDTEAVDGSYREADAMDRLCSLENTELRLNCYFYRLSRAFGSGLEPADMEPQLSRVEETYGKLPASDQAYLERLNWRSKVLLTRVRGAPVPIDVPEKFLGIEGAPRANLVTWKTICLAKGPVAALEFLSELKRRNGFDLALWRKSVSVYAKTHPPALYQEIKLCAGDELKLN